MYIYENRSNFAGSIPSGNYTYTLPGLDTPAFFLPYSDHRQYYEVVKNPIKKIFITFTLLGNAGTQPDQLTSMSIKAWAYAPGFSLCFQWIKVAGILTHGLGFLFAFIVHS